MRQETERNGEKAVLRKLTTTKLLLHFFTTKNDYKGLVRKCITDMKKHTSLLTMYITGQPNNLKGKNKRKIFSLDCWLSHK